MNTDLIVAPHVGAWIETHYLLGFGYERNRKFA